ncbi:hypothetical protein AAY473_000517 [Plecturocebus cupreus]
MQEPSRCKAEVPAGESMGGSGEDKNIWLAGLQDIVSKDREMGFHHDGQVGLELLTLGDPPTSASQSARITGKPGFSHVGQAGLKLLTSADPPALASQSAGITGVSQRSQYNILESSWRFLTLGLIIVTTPTTDLECVASLPHHHRLHRASSTPPVAPSHVLHSWSHPHGRRSPNPEPETMGRFRRNWKPC